MLSMDLETVTSVKGREEPLLPLDFLLLEVLELDAYSNPFPAWMRIPSTLKFFTETLHSNMPSISELWLPFSAHWERSTDSCPLLEVLRFEAEDSLDPETLPQLLSDRRQDVRSGLETEGVEVVDLRRLIIPFERWGSTLIYWIDWGRWSRKW